MDGYTGYQARRSTQEKFKMTDINFAILNSHVIVEHLKFIKSTNFYGVKAEKMEIDVFSIYLLFIYTNKMTMKRQY